jgi:hypothetical protein
MSRHLRQGAAGRSDVFVAEAFDFPGRAKFKVMAFLIGAATPAGRRGETRRPKFIHIFRPWLHFFAATLLQEVCVDGSSLDPLQRHVIVTGKTNAIIEFGSKIYDFAAQL